MHAYTADASVFLPQWLVHIMYNTQRHNATQAAATCSANALNKARVTRPRARFAKYLMIILPLSYDNAKVTIDLRRTTNLQNISRRTQGFS